MSIGWFQALLSAAPSQTYDLLRFSVKYRTSNFSYLTSAPFSDTASFRTGSNVIRVATAVPDGTAFSNTVVASVYLYNSNPASERIIIREGDTQDVIILDMDWVEVGRISTINYSQGLCYNPVTQHIFSYAQGVNTVTETDLSGNVIATYSASIHSSDIHWHYDYINDIFYVAKETGTPQVTTWRINGGTFELVETLWYRSADAIALDNIFDKIVNFDNQGGSSATRIREQAIDGTDGVVIYPGPIVTGFQVEGMAVMPDGTYIFADPSGFHTSIVGGNRLWWCDGRAVYRKFDRSPSMVRFSRFSGGTLSGQFDTQKITQAVGQKIYSPVYDTNGFTNTENANAWEFEFSEGGDADITWRGSNTAPTLSPSTHYLSDQPNYDGWGATVPSSEQGTPGTFRYKQAVLTVKDASAPTEITIQDLIDLINPKFLIVAHDSEMMYVYTDSTSPVNQIPIWINQADPSNNFQAPTAGNSFSFNVASSYSDDQSNNASSVLQTPSLITSDSQGQLVVVHRREATNTQSIFIDCGTSGSNNNRLVLRHNASAGSPASGIAIEQWSGAGAVNNRVYVADTSVTFKRIDFLSSGSAWQIWLDRVNQSLTNDVGANNGNWFGDISSPNIFRVGFTNASGGRGRYRLLIYKDSAMTEEMNDLIDAYITQENLLA